MTMGRPLLFNSPEELQAQIDEYFDSEEKPTMSGLAYELGIDRKTLLNYSNREEFFPTIKRAKARVERFVESRLYEQNVAGAIFNLKNNFDWKDKSEIEANGNLTININKSPKATGATIVGNHDPA